MLLYFTVTFTKTSQWVLDNCFAIPSGACINTANDLLDIRNTMEKANWEPGRDKSRTHTEYVTASR